MIIWTPTVLNVLYVCVLYFCICTCSAQLSMFHMERRSRNTLIIIISIITLLVPLIAGVLVSHLLWIQAMYLSQCPPVFMVLQLFPWLCPVFPFVTSDLNTGSPVLPCQVSGVIGSALGLVSPVSVYCDWVR